ncbi:MAG: radical SAM protein [Myxococcales bacterium]|nr:radical SAM protein [Myxococcales bacterium]
MKALVKVGYACNENCTFCHTADVRHQNDSADRVEWKIERARALGYDMVVLSGGEPTIRPELRRWAAKVASLDMDLGLVTNGLVLSYRGLADELIEEHRLRYVYLSLHGGTAKVHRSVVRADTFAQALAAIDNLEGRVPDLTINCVVTTANLESLGGLVDLLAERSGLTLKLSMTQPKGGAAHAFDVIVPDVEACARAIHAAITRGIERGATIGFAHDGVPLCLLPGLEHLYDDLKTHRYATMIEADEDDFVPVDDVAKIHPPACDDCALKGPCPGLYRGYAESRGSGALRPVLGRARSNSYNLLPERDLAGQPGPACPVRAFGVSPFDRGRTLLLKLRDRLRLYRTETRDFTDAELASTKLEREQIYVDVSRKLFSDDFARDLRKLTRSPACASCPDDARCTGAYEPIRADLFSRDDARVREILAGLRGRILDVGCGEGRYLDALAPAMDRGEVTYLGLDPEEERLALLAARHPRASFLAAHADELPAEGEPFDHALFLRSFNHLPDARRAISAVLERLAPGGTLLLVDNVAFGLVREAAVAKRAEAAPAGFEHHRNDGAAEALARLDGLPLTLVERRDVARDTSNQWLLRFERRAVS